MVHGLSMWSGLASTLQLRSERSSAPDHTHHRLSWCPYIPQEEGEDEEEGWLLATSHGCEVCVCVCVREIERAKPSHAG